MADDLIKVTEASARSGFFLFSGTAVATVIMAVAAILIGRLLGPELYGQYTLAFVIPQILFLLTDLGISQGITKYTANFNAKGENSRIERLLKYALMLRALVATVLFGLNFLLAEVLASLFLQRPDLAFYVKIASTSILFQAIFSTSISAFVGLDRSEYNAIATNVQAFAKTTISILLVVLGLGVTGAVIGLTTSYLIGAITGTALLYFLLRKRQNRKAENGGSNDLRALIRYGTPLYISILLSGLIPFYQNIVLSNFTTYIEIGNYKAATNFYSLVTVLSVPITTALLPAFSKIDSSTMKKVKLFFKLVNRFTSIIIMPVALLVIVYSGEIVGIVYGPTYEYAPSFLSTYCLLFLLVGLGSITLVSFYNGLGETKTTLTISLFTFLPLLILSPLMTRAFKVQGLIAAFLMSSAIGTAYAVYHAKKRFQLEFGASSLAKIYIVALVSCTPSLAISHLELLPKALLLYRFSIPVNLVIGAFLYIGFYLTLLPLAKIIDRSDLQAIEKVSKKIPLLKFVISPLLRYEQKILRTKRET